MERQQPKTRQPAQDLIMAAWDAGWQTDEELKDILHRHNQLFVYTIIDREGDNNEFLRLIGEALDAIMLIEQTYKAELNVGTIQAIIALKLADLYENIDSHINELIDEMLNIAVVQREETTTIKLFLSAIYDMVTPENGMTKQQFYRVMRAIGNTNLLTITGAK